MATFWRELPFSKPSFVGIHVIFRECNFQWSELHEQNPAKIFQEAVRVYPGRKTQDLPSNGWQIGHLQFQVGGFNPFEKY